MADVTKMAVKVDLTCKKCKKKIKKVLCKIPEIENMEYDEKNNTVNVTVVCCNPEKIKNKIRCKGGRIIIGIDIIKPPPNKEQAPSKKDQAPVKKDPKPAESLSKPKLPPPCDCCKECYVFYPWGSYCPGPGWPSPPCYCFCHSCYRRPVCDCWGSGCRRCYLICEENPTTCTIM